MEKNISVQIFEKANEISIGISWGLIHLHKEPIHVNENLYKEEAKKISSLIKNIKGFKSFSIGFGAIDWYESCNGFNIPYFFCGSDKKLKSSYHTSNDIPKDWEVFYALRMEYPDNVRGVNKFIEAMKIPEKHAEEIIKAIKTKTNTEIDWR